MSHARVISGLKGASAALFNSSALLLFGPVASHAQAISGPATGIGQQGSNITSVNAGPVSAAGGGGFGGDGAAATNTQNVSTTNVNTGAAISGAASSTGFYGGGYPCLYGGYGCAAYRGYGYGYRPGRLWLGDRRQHRN